MCARGHRVAAAVSGGADSVCLLYILHELAPKLGITLSVAHLNHKLRGAESDADADFVRALAQSLGVEFFYREIAVAEAGGNLEEAARDARIRFFQQLPVDRVALGHTRSDQAETVIYRLLRGAGTAGLAGILPVAGIRIRPLIECTHGEAVEFLRAQGRSWREDSTNADVTLARNWLRHQILPRLGPGADAVLARTADLARDEEEYWTGQIDSYAAAFFETKPNSVVLNIENLKKLPLAVKRRLVRRAISDVKGNLRQIDLFHVDSILALAANAMEGHGRAQAPGIDVFRSFEWLRICLPRGEARSERDYCLPLKIPGRTPIQVQARHLQVEVAENTENIQPVGEYNAVSSLLDIQGLSGALELRNWRPGDRFTRIGHATDKIKTLFQLARIPLWERQGWPVVTSGEHIVWTRRFGVSAEFTPALGSNRILHVVEEESYSAESNLSDSASQVLSVSDRDSPHREME